MKRFINGLSGLTDRRSCLILSSLVLLALVLRIAALLSLKGSVYFDFLLWDERLYHDWAVEILNGTHRSLSVYASLMALVYKLFSVDILYIRILNIIFGVLTCYLLYLIGKEMAGRSTGLLACAVAALYEPFIFYSIVPLNTSLSLFLFSSTVFLYASCFRHHAWSKALLLGMAAGLLYKVRPNSVVIIPFLPLFFLLEGSWITGSFKKWSLTCLTYGLGLAVALAPFTTKEDTGPGKSRGTTSQSGLNLYLGNNLHNLDPYYRPVPFAVSAPREQAIQFNIEASRRLGKRLSPGESSSYWTGEAIRMAMKDPAAFVWKLCQKALVLFNRFEAGDHYHIGFMKDFVPFFRLPFLGFWLVLPFGMTGMAFNLFGCRKVLSLGLIFLLYGATLVVFFTNTRYRLPLLVLLIPFALLGMQNLLTYVKKRQFRKIGVYAGVVIAFLVIEFLPVRGTNDMTAYYNTHAIILNAKGFEEEAIKYWERSSRMKGAFSAFANLALAGESMRKKDSEKATYFLDMIPDDSFAAAQKYDMLGDIHIIQSNPLRAISAYERSLEINSGLMKTRLKLVKILWRVDKQRALEEHDKLEYVAAFYGGGAVTDQ